MLPSLPSRSRAIPPAVQGVRRWPQRSRRHHRCSKRGRHWRPGSTHEPERIARPVERAWDGSPKPLTSHRRVIRRSSEAVVLKAKLANCEHRYKRNLTHCGIKIMSSNQRFRTRFHMVECNSPIESVLVLHRSRTAPTLRADDTAVSRQAAEHNGVYGSTAPNGRRIREPLGLEINSARGRTGRAAPMRDANVAKAKQPHAANVAGLC